jgi:hypothetical protein
MGLAELVKADDERHAKRERPTAGSACPNATDGVG